MNNCIVTHAKGEHHGDMHSTRDSALAFVAGKKVSEIVALGEEIYDEEMAGKIWSGTHALAQGQLAGERPLRPLGDNDLLAVAVMRGAFGPDRQVLCSTVTSMLSGSTPGRSASTW